MNARKTVLLTVGVLLLLSAGSAPSRSQTPVSTLPGEAPHPIEVFAPLIGGTWHMGDSFSVFEWGLDRKSVHAVSYAATPAGERPVSEAMWFWHPGERKLRGYCVAEGMPFEVLEMTTTGDEGRVLESRLVAIDSSGQSKLYRERFQFSPPDSSGTIQTYMWTLYERTDEGDTPIMSAEARRAP